MSLITKLLHLKYQIISQNDTILCYKTKAIKESFNFELVSYNDAKKEIENLNIKKSSTQGSIPASTLRQCIGAYLPQLTNSINCSFQHNSFPQELKLSKVIPLYKELEPLQKKNYRPESLLPHISKVLERIILRLPAI